MLEGGDFGECRRAYCPKTTPCTFEGCGRPAFDPWCNEVILLYQECQKRNAMPSAGGVMDQPADLMRWFRVIDAKREEHKPKETARV